MTAPKSWRDILPVHAAANLFPMLSEAELRELGEDIRKNGLQIPIALYKEQDRYVLLDGRNRLDAMELVGVQFELRSVKGCSFCDWYVHIVSTPITPGRDCLVIENDDPFAFVLAANIHRRHLTTEQKRELIAKLLKATPEKSNRQIADTVKASHVTVGAVRSELESTGQIDQLTRTVGKDGRARKTSKGKPVTEAELVELEAEIMSADDDPIIKQALCLFEQMTERQRDEFCHLACIVMLEKKSGGAIRTAKAAALLMDVDANGMPKFLKRIQH
ncbi:ParB-like nuclease domain-containing protein [Bradyrhizobium sp. Ghvi]|uniref:ParB/RepB/Spo0J family partition protein n=1 Tax=Bradyrhizobium sp. Ghvi TaxID=1855319 RepID=UPI0008F27150|nr:ParB N-terminal domain-containing protein [Bradyrhizobium sp. Ghvi]SFP94806.1 ParB-like nuclease domain-containing protein [Bradyrhizobium sp. Ghvi]